MNFLRNSLSALFFNIWNKKSSTHCNFCNRKLYKEDYITFLSNEWFGKLKVDIGGGLIEESREKSIQGTLGYLGYFICNKCAHLKINEKVMGSEKGIFSNEKSELWK